MRLRQRLQISELPCSLSFHPYPFSTFTLHSPTVCFLDLALLAHWQNASGCSCKNEGKNIDGLDGEIKHIDIHRQTEKKSVRKILTDKNRMQTDRETDRQRDTETERQRRKDRQI